MKNEFLSIMEDFSSISGLNLKIEESSCIILFDEKLEVFFEYVPERSAIQIACFITALPPGKFREDILLNALVANTIYYPQVGTFAYSSKATQLCLFRYVEIENLNGEILSEKLAGFLNIAFEWKNSIELENIAPKLELKPFS